MLLSYVSQHKCHRIKRKKEKRALKTYLEPSINGGCERLRLKANNGSIDVEFRLWHMMTKSEYFLEEQRLYACQILFYLGTWVEPYVVVTRSGELAVLNVCSVLM